MPARLDGLTLLVTRPEGKTADLARRFRELGAEVVEEPLTRTVALADAEYAPLDAAVDSIGRYDWVIFTSVEGVRFFLERAWRRGREASLPRLVPPRVRLAAIGSETAGALARAGRPADLVPEDFRAEGLVSALARSGGPTAGRRHLLVRAEQGREVLPEALRAAGGEIDVAVAYRTGPVPGAAERAAELIGAGGVSLVILTSGAAAQALRDALAARPELIAKTRVAALGPVTAECAANCGFSVGVVAREATLDSLVEAVVAGVSGE